MIMHTIQENPRPRRNSTLSPPRFLDPKKGGELGCRNF
jgi:hypothetical protein